MLKNEINQKMITIIINNYLNIWFIFDNLSKIIKKLKENYCEANFYTALTSSIFYSLTIQQTDLSIP